MLDQEAWAIAEGRISAEFAQRESSFTAELTNAQSEFAKAGALRSSGMAAKIGEICAKEAEARTKRAWEIILGLLQETKWYLFATL